MTARSAGLAAAGVVALARPIPDAVIPNTPAGFEVFVAFDAEAPEGERGERFSFDEVADGSASIAP